MKTKLIALISWIVSLESAVFEYGLDIDFPLTPLLWLSVAVCALAAAMAYASQNPVGWPGDTTSLCQSSIPSGNHAAPPIAGLFAHYRARSARRFRSISQQNLSVAHTPGIQPASCSIVVNTRDAAPPVIFFCSATTRGPPCASNQSLGPFNDVPRFSPVPPLSELSFSNLFSVAGVLT